MCIAKPGRDCMIMDRMKIVAIVIAVQGWNRMDRIARIGGIEKVHHRIALPGVPRYVRERVCVLRWDSLLELLQAERGK